MCYIRDSGDGLCEASTFVYGSKNGDLFVLS